MEAKAESDEEFGMRLAKANRTYEKERDALLDPGTSPAPSGGVGGTGAGVKCLHAHYAHTRGGGDNPVGELVAGWIEPLHCEAECVVGGELNPDWVNAP